jgi:hypothetical protein
VLDTDDSDQWARVIDAIKEALTEPREDGQRVLGFHQEDDEPIELEDEEEEEELKKKKTLKKK